MQHRRLAILVLATALAALALVGCGEMSKQEYQKKADRIGRRAERQMDTIFKGGKPPTSRSLQRASAVIDDAAGEMEDLHPPAAVKTAHDRMVRGLHGLADAFGRLADDLKDAKTDEQRAKVFLKMGQDDDAKKAFDDLSAAEKAFAKAGYKVFSNNS